MIVVNSLGLRDGDVERSLKLAKKLEIEEVKLFKELDPKLIRIGKNLTTNFIKNYFNY